MTPDEFSAFAEDWYPRAKRHMRKRLPGRWEHAEDAVQWAFYDLWRAHTRLESIEHARRYLWKTLGYQETRALRRLYEIEEVELNPALAQRFPSEHVVDDRFDTSADQLLLLLGPRCREMLRRHVIDGVPSKVIAADEGVAESRVSQILKSARLRLRAALEVGCHAVC